MSEKISKRQKIAAVMLGSGYRIAEVADKLSVAEETVSRWKKNADFSELCGQAHIDFLDAVVAERQVIVSKCHHAIRQALDNTEISELGKANMAIRYLATSGAQTGLYNHFQQKMEYMISVSEQSTQAFRHVMETLDALCELKSSNGYLTDAEYRKKAEDIVRM